MISSRACSVTTSPSVRPADPLSGLAAVRIALEAARGKNLEVFSPTIGRQPDLLSVPSLIRAPHRLRWLGCERQRWLRMFRILPFGSRTKKRRTPHGSSVNGYKMSQPIS